MPARTKRLAILFYLLIALYVGFVIYAAPLRPQNNLCDNPVVAAFAPWDSGCFYKAAYGRTASSAQVDYEQKKLETFMSRGGFAHQVLWYRSVLFRTYDKHLKVSLDEIRQAHDLYTKGEPYRIDIQFAFWRYLYDSGHIELAQQTLDGYCDKFVYSKSAFLIEDVPELLSNADLNLTFDACTAAAQRSKLQ